MSIELTPIQITITKNKKQLVGFLHPHTDQIFIFKDINRQARLQLFGSFRNIHTEENDLQVYDTLSNLQKQGAILQTLN
tara:strand:+ start:353 stop:589 length:237 start_codon:yes stop_codon:yes gene_type:complete